MVADSAREERTPGRSRRRCAALTLGAALALGALPARSEAPRAPSLRLSVVRSQDAADCPDQTEFAALVDALARPDAPPAGAVLVDAQFFRERGQYTVALRVSGDRTGQRTLHDPGAACASLAEAAALTVAILLDPDRPAPPAPPPTAPPLVAPSVTVPAPIEVWSFWAAAGPLLTTGLTATPAAGAVVEVGLDRTSGWRLGVGVLWLPEREFRKAPGALDVSLLAATGRGCWLGAAGPVRVGGCGRVAAGAYTASARGYSTNLTPQEAWVGAGATGVVEGPVTGPLSWGAEVGWMASPRSRAFVIGGVGKPFDPSAAGGLWASLVLRTRL